MNAREARQGASKVGRRIPAARLLLFGISLAMSIALVFAVGETALRLSFGSARSYRLSEIVRAHPVRGWQLHPGEYDYFNVAAFSRARFTISKPGIRGVQVAPRVAAGRRRIAIVGDSFVFSEALSDGETAADRLGEILGPSSEVLNLGVPGYGTGQEWLWLEELHASGFDLGDRLVLAVFTNDISDNSALSYGTSEANRYQPSFSIEDGRVVHARPPESFPAPVERTDQAELLRDSLFLKFLVQRAGVLGARMAGVVDVLASLGYRLELPRTPGIIPAWYGEGWETRWALTQELLRHLANRAREWGVRDLHIVFVPSPFQVEEVFLRIAREQRSGVDYDAFFADVLRPQRLFLDFCARSGLTCHDLTPKLRNTGESAFFLREGHLNAHGSRRFAEALAGWLGKDSGAGERSSDAGR